MIMKPLEHIRVTCPNCGCVRLRVERDGNGYKLDLHWPMVASDHLCLRVYADPADVRAAALEASARIRPSADDVRAIYDAARLKAEAEVEERRAIAAALLKLAEST